MKIVIFAGGVGTRLWPLSRKKTPKQFEKIINNQSTLQLAVDRLRPTFSWSDIYISTGERYTDLVKKQLPKIPVDNVIGEPEMRDVGPAVGFITAILVKKFPNEPLAILWSDHLIKKVDLFLKVLLLAEKIVKKDQEKIIFIGQKARFASCNLGWIESGKLLEEKEGLPVYEFKNLRYRPKPVIAQEYFQDKKYSWNPGYFVSTPAFLWKQYQRFVPDLYRGLLEIQQSHGTKNYQTVLRKIYPTLEKISFDNAILEQLEAKAGLVISTDLGWSDVGAWEALKEAMQKFNEDNVLHGRVCPKDTKDCLVYNYTGQTVFTIDLSSMLVISTPDVVLICPKNSVPKIKKLVESLTGTEYESLT